MKIKKDMLTLQSKKCSTCKEVKTIEEFTNNKNNKDGKQYFCKPCGLAKRKDWVGRNKHKQREYHIKAKYKLTLVEYEDLLLQQKHKCAICKTPEPKGKTNTWHIDHCHTSGVVRGILCAKCNLMLGQADDNVETLLNAIEYIRKGGE